eukprot:scaffold3926_cov124-Isochrysis_galbana.AAC.5
MERCSGGRRAEEGRRRRGASARASQQPWLVPFGLTSMVRKEGQMGARFRPRATLRSSEDAVFWVSPS